ncbi:MAG: Uma2 family endonuclease [Saprospiraceae bacterium]
MTVSPKKRLTDVQEYHRMFEVGILTEADRLELINGEILEMSPIGNRHAATVDRIGNYLAYHLYQKAIVRVQNPIITDSLSEPEPDITILRLREDYYRDQHPGAEDVLLLIEVADSSINYDREIKLPLYARAGIPVYWIVDIEEERVEVYTMPAGERYTTCSFLQGEDRLAIPGLGLVFGVEDLLG